MDYDSLLQRYLETNEDLDNPDGMPGRQEIVAEMERWPGFDMARLKQIRVFVRANGRPFTPSRLPDGLPPWGQGDCFRLSIQRARDWSMTYVEGFALTRKALVAVHHGWLAEPDGSVLDSTWGDDGAAYFGVPFSSDFITRKAPAFEGEVTERTPKSLIYDQTDDFSLLNGRVEGRLG